MRYLENGTIIYCQGNYHKYYYHNCICYFRTAPNGLNEYIAVPKKDINAINKNTSLLREVRDKFSKYKEASQNEQIKILKEVTDKLDKSVCGMFLSVEAALKHTTEKLNESYNSFTEMCTKFNENYSYAIDSKQIADAITVLLAENKKLAAYFKDFKGRI